MADGSTYIKVQALETNTRNGSTGSGTGGTVIFSFTLTWNLESGISGYYGWGPFQIVVNNGNGPESKTVSIPHDNPASIEQNIQQTLAGIVLKSFQDNFGYCAV